MSSRPLVSLFYCGEMWVYIAQKLGTSRSKNTQVDGLLPRIEPKLPWSGAVGLITARVTPGLDQWILTTCHVCGRKIYIVSL